MPHNAAQPSLAAVFALHRLQLGRVFRIPERGSLAAESFLSIVPYKFGADVIIEASGLVKPPSNAICAALKTAPRGARA